MSQVLCESKLFDLVLVFRVIVYFKYLGVSLVVAIFVSSVIGANTRLSVDNMMSFLDSFVS